MSSLDDHIRCERPAKLYGPFAVHVNTIRIGLATRPTSHSRKLLRLAEDILRLASRLAAAYGLRLRLTAKIG